MTRANCATWLGTVAITVITAVAAAALVWWANDQRRALDHLADRKRYP